MQAPLLLKLLLIRVLPVAVYLIIAFATPVDLSAAGTYTLDVTIAQAGDPVSANDSKTKIVKQLLNPSITGIIPAITFC